MKLKLHKNEELVLEIEGKLDGLEAVFGNIIYNASYHTLTREDAGYKYLIDFDNETAEVELKEYNKILPLSIKVIAKKYNKKSHKIIYNIESEQTIKNVLEVFF